MLFNVKARSNRANESEKTEGLTRDEAVKRLHEIAEQMLTTIADDERLSKWKVWFTENIDQTIARYMESAEKEQRGYTVSAWVVIESRNESDRGVAKRFYFATVSPKVVFEENGYFIKLEPRGNSMDAHIINHANGLTLDEVNKAFLLLESQEPRFYRRSEYRKSDSFIIEHDFTTGILFSGSHSMVAGYTYRGKHSRLQEYAVCIGAHKDWKATAELGNEQNDES